MPRLDNPRHEKFCQNYALGMSGAAAYRKVYGESILGDRQSAHNLLTNADIIERIEELRDKGEAEFTLTMQDRRRFTARTVKVNPTTFDFDKDGDLVQQIEYHEDGTVKKFTLAGKLDAVMADAKLAGDLTEKTETTHIGDPSAPLVVQLPTIITKPRPRRSAASQAVSESEPPAPKSP